MKTIVLFLLALCVVPLPLSAETPARDLNLQENHQRPLSEEESRNGFQDPESPLRAAAAGKNVPRRIPAGYAPISEAERRIPPWKRVSRKPAVLPVDAK